MTEKPDGGSGKFDDPDFWEDIEDDMQNTAEDRMEAINEAIKEDVEKTIRKDHRHIPHPNMADTDVYLHEPPTSRTISSSGNGYEEAILV